MYLKICFTLFLFFLFGCNNNKEKRLTSAPENGTFSHPVRELIPNKEDLNLIDINQRLSSNNFINNKSLEQILNIGNNNSIILGTIAGTVLDSENNVLMLDRDQPSIRKFNTDGKLLDVYHRAGRGPEDLLEPTDIEIDKNDDIYIANGLFSIKVFSSKGDSISFLRSINTGQIPSNDLCLMNDKIFIRSLGKYNSKSDSLNLVHVFSTEDGTFIKSFGTPYESGNLRLSSGGKIECNESNDMISYTFEYFPFIYGYTSDGEFRWASEVPNFNGPRVEEVIKNGVSQSFRFGKSEGDISEYLSSINTFKNNYLIVQTSWTKQNKGSSIESGFKSYFLNIKNGKLVYFTEDLPLISFIDENMLVEYAYGRNIHSQINAYEINEK